jgi:hypothetical protein
MNDLPPIKNAQSLVDVYGYFPSFHDAEIISLTCNRGDADSVSATIEFTIHGWEMTSEVDTEGYYVLHKHHLVTFKFSGVVGVKLKHFLHQNVLFELIITEIKDPTDDLLISVELPSSYGLEGNFRAISGEVVSITPCNTDGTKIGSD